MQFTFTKGKDRYDELRVIREDGSQQTIQCPKQRIIPHEMVHFAVESTLRKRGFMTRLRQGEATAAGADAESDGVERLVEVFQGDAWSGGSAPAAELLDLYAVTCRARACPPLSVAVEDLAAIRSRIEELDRAWQALAVGSMMALAM